MQARTSLVQVGIFWAAVAACSLVLGLGWCPPALAAGVAKTKGQTVYVPAYTYVYFNEKGAKFPLTTTLLVHNTDSKNGIKLTSIKYFDSEGALVSEFAEKPKALAPLEALEVLVKKPPRKKGSGACFLVAWQAAKKVSPPIVECIMIGAQGQQGISYRSTGQVIGR